MEEIRSTDFDNIYSYYTTSPNDTFKISKFFPSGSPIADVDNQGEVVVNNTIPDCLQVEVYVCWRQRGGRIIGGHLVGTTLDADATSPAKLVTRITKYR